MARGVKRIAEQGLVRSGLVSLVTRRARPSSAILAYHNIVPHGKSPAGDLSLHTDQAAFASQLDWISSRYRIVPLGELLSERRPGDAEARVAITFDDAYRGTLTAGVEELSDRDLPATVFVPPGLLGRDGFWWDLLSGPGRPLDPELREHALRELGGRQDEILEFAQDEGLRLQALPKHAQPATAGELEGVRGTGVSFGNHTWSHPDLAAMATDLACHEVVHTTKWLNESGLPLVQCLAYPYGIASPSAVEALGAQPSALLVDGGPCEVRGVFRGTPGRIPRINVPRGLSLEGLALRLAGIL